MDEGTVLKTVGRETDLGVRFSLPPQYFEGIAEMVKATD